MPDELNDLSKIILKRFHAHTTDHVFTFALSGIDASGKGYVTKLLEDELVRNGLKVANINIDPWQNPIPVRLQKQNAAENFYKNVFRWNDVFEQLIVPLRRTGSIHLATKLIHSHADDYYDFVYAYKEIDILLIEAIFLFQKKYLHYYDLNVWVESSFETGLERARERNVERLSEEKLISDYNTYYYPAQGYHFEQDGPKGLSHVIYCNDQLLGTVGQVTSNF